MRSELDHQCAEYDLLREENANTLAKLSALQARLEEERKSNQEKLSLIDEAQRKLADAFKALSADALRNNNQSFIELAKANFDKLHDTAKGDLESGRKEIIN